MPILPRQPNMLFENIAASEDALYLHSTKLQSEFYTGLFTEQVQKWQDDPNQVAKSARNFKIFYNAPFFPMRPDLQKFKRINWERAVLQRRSQRHFDSRPILFSQLSTLLLLCTGLKKNGKWLKLPPPDPLGHVDMGQLQSCNRALPSGGALYPLELYLLVRRVKGLSPGLYHVNVLFQALSQLVRHDQPMPLAGTIAQDVLFGEPAVVLFVTAVFERTRVKYGARGLRYIMLEAGGLGTQMNLLANAMGLSFCYDGGGYEDRIESLLGIDGEREGLISQLMLGHSKE